MSDFCVFRGCDSPGVSDTGGGVGYAADAGALSAGTKASNVLGD